jgi:ABC-2 type transport system ATP-binding protein
MSAGRLVAQGPLAELRQSGEARIRLVTPDAGMASGVLARLGMVPVAGAPEPDGDVVTAVAAVSREGDGPEEHSAQQDIVAPENVVARLVEAGVRVRGFSVERESLEERFVALTGEGFDVAQ